MAGTRAVPLNAPLGMGPPAVVAARLAGNLQEVLKLLDGQSGLSKDPLEDLGLQRTTGMDGDDHLPSLALSMAECHMTSHLMVHISPYPGQGPNEPISGQTPGQLAHIATSTVASSIADSSGMGSPCFRQLSR